MHAFWGPYYSALQVSCEQKFKEHCLSNFVLRVYRLSRTEATTVIVLPTFAGQPTCKALYYYECTNRYVDVQTVRPQGRTVDHKKGL